MPLSFKKYLKPETGRPEAPLVDEQDLSLNVTVVFTSLGATLAALKKAGGLADSLGARIRLVVPLVVPYPLSLANPPVPVEFQERRFREIAANSSLAIEVQLYFCRDKLEALKLVLEPHSLIVIGGRTQLWPTREKGLACKLRRAGHEVIFTGSR
jgi:hypothetical protein